jgi:archaellum component FlaC
MITEETISTMSEKIYGLKKTAERLLENISLLEHHCEDYMKFLNEENKCVDEFLSDYADDIEGYINDIETDVADISDEAETFLESLVDKL